MSDDPPRPSQSADRFVARPSVVLPEVGGGEAACWLNRMCPECGRLDGHDDAQVCAQCGASLA